MEAARLMSKRFADVLLRYASVLFSKVAPLRTILRHSARELVS